MGSPYDTQPERAFWRTGVAERDPLHPGDLYHPRFKLRQKHSIVTAGSCFAQHIGRALRQADFDVLDAEPLPPYVPQQVANKFGYGVYSARYGNIYTARHLKQLLEEVCGETSPALPVWEKDGRFYDAQRPGVEPDGLPDEETVLAHRATHLASIKELFQAADVFVFTFGLTECWLHRESGTVYPSAPGVVAGTYDPELFEFKNLAFNEVLADFTAVRKRLLEWNPKIRILVTVSPVPLTATAANQHIEVATCYSKAVLRAVCGTLVSKYRNVDYVPSYELITSPKARGLYFNQNMRSVTRSGVNAAMNMFLSAQGVKQKVAQPKPNAGVAFDPSCEDALIEAFAP